MLSLPAAAAKTPKAPSCGLLAVPDRQFPAGPATEEKSLKEDELPPEQLEIPSELKLHIEVPGACSERAEVVKLEDKGREKAARTGWGSDDPDAIPNERMSEESIAVPNSQRFIIHSTRMISSSKDVLANIKVQPPKTAKPVD